MSSILLDTHAWAWSLLDDARLSAVAVKAMGAAETVFVPAIALFEIGQKVRLGKWPEMAPIVEDLVAIGTEQGARFVALSAPAGLLAATLDWSHRDPFDRIVAATAIEHGLPLISADPVFDGLRDHVGWPGRRW